MKFDGLIQTYQRGHKAVMNTHTVGGNSEKTKYVGMDQYGNKYYECFDALRKYKYFIKIIIKEDGYNTMTFYQLEVQTAIEFHQNGKDGYTINMTTYHFLIVIHSKIHSSKSHTVGITQHQLLNYMYQELRQFILNFCNTDNKEQINLLLNGRQLLKELDLDR